MTQPQQTQDIVYDIPTRNDAINRHTLSVLVDNEFGVLARVIGLFSGRGYNIESLTVAEVEHETAAGAGGRSRITIVTSGTEIVIEQIKRLLERMVPVYRVHDLTVEGPHVERELALLKIVGDEKSRQEALRIVDMFRGRVVDSGAESFIFEFTGELKQIDECVEMLRPLGLSEICRTGVAAMMRGKEGI